MRAVQMQGVREPLQVVTVDEPTPGPRDAVVEVSACGVCRSDWHLWQGDWTWENISVELPRTLGHEASGIVHSVGDQVRSIVPEAAVCIPFHEACGQCGYCLSGRTHLCPHADYLGSTHDGAFAQFVRIPNAEVNCIPLPPGVDPVDAAAMGCRYMTAFHAAIHRGRARGGQWAVVFGCGGLGLSLVQILAAIGAQVIAVDISAPKLELAARLGAVHVIDSTAGDPVDAIQELTDGGAHVTFDALGASTTFLAGISSLRRGARHVQVGLTSGTDAGTSTVPLDHVTLTEIEILGSFGNPIHTYPELLALVARGQLRPRELITRQISLDEVPEAIGAMSSYDLSGLVVARVGDCKEADHGERTHGR